MKYVLAASIGFNVVLLIYLGHAIDGGEVLWRQVVNGCITVITVVLVFTFWRSNDP